MIICKNNICNSNDNYSNNRLNRVELRAYLSEVLFKCKPLLSFLGIYGITIIEFQKFDNCYQSHNQPQRICIS